MVERGALEKEQGTPKHYGEDARKKRGRNTSLREMCTVFLKLPDCNPVSYFPKGWEFWEGKRHYLIKGMIILPIYYDRLVTNLLPNGGLDH